MKRAAGALYPRPTFVLYHADCADGFGAAFAAWCALGDGQGDSPVHYLPVWYGQDFPEIPDEARVYIVDFSYPHDSRARKDLCALAERCELTVIDHHRTAQETLAGLDFAHFDLTKSGAVLTWEYFQGRADEWAEDAYGVHGEPPELLLYVQDRDLWQWKLPNSREFSAGLSLVPREFDRWLGIIDPDAGRRKDIIRDGVTVLRRDAALVAAICNGAIAGWLRSPAGAIQVVCVNTPVLQSEVCHQLLEGDPTRQVVAAFFDKGMGERVWSLRSRPGYDCGAIAKLYGGGGHPQAAGFTQSIVWQTPVAKG